MSDFAGRLVARCDLRKEVPRSLIVKGEAFARVQAEKELVKEFADEYRQFADELGHVEAVLKLVRDHKIVYDGLCRVVRDRYAGQPDNAAA